MTFLCKKCKSASARRHREADGARGFPEGHDRLRGKRRVLPQCALSGRWEVSDGASAIITTSAEVAATRLTAQVIDAKTPTAILGVEGDDARKDARILKDERVEQRDRLADYEEMVTTRLG